MSSTYVSGVASSTTPDFGSNITFRLSLSLVREATVAFFATVQNEGGRQVERNLEYFNMDVIISVAKHNVASGFFLIYLLRVFIHPNNLWILESVRIFQTVSS